jgi:hypothetical protein
MYCETFRIFYLIFSSEKYWKKLLGSRNGIWFVFRLLSSLFFGQISVATNTIQIQLFDWIQINGFKSIWFSFRPAYSL